MSERSPPLIGRLAARPRNTITDVAGITVGHAPFGCSCFLLIISDIFVSYLLTRRTPMLTATLRKWGGSVALPIPPAILSSLGLHSGAEVSLSISDGRLVIEPARKYSFDELLAQHKALGLDLDREWLEFPALPSEQS